MCPELLPLGSGENKVRPRLKMVGVGGAGCNAVANSSFENVGLCTSRDVPSTPTIGRRVVLSDDHLRFVRSTSPRLITSLDHEIPKRLMDAIGQADLMFIFAGLGGETGSYVTPGIVHLCRRISHLVVVSAALPFSVEGIGRREIANKSLTEILDASHMAITYPNDALLKMVPNLPIRRAFKVMDGIMMMPVLELGEVLTVGDLPLLKNDFLNASYVRLGVGTGRGDQREAIAVEEAFSSPWFDFALDKVTAAVVVASTDDPDAIVNKKILHDIGNRLPNAKIRHAMRRDRALNEKVRVTVLLGVAHP